MRLLPFCVLVLSVAAALPAQDDEPLDVAGMTKDIAKAAKRRGDQDAHAIGLLGQLKDAAKKLDKRGRAQTVKAARACLRAKRKPNEAHLLVAAAATLERMGPDGGKVLLSAIDDSRFKNEKPWRAFRAGLVTHVGKIADKRFIKPLVDLMRKDSDAAVSAMAGGALGAFAKQPGKVRKSIVKELIKELERVHGLANAQHGGNIGIGDSSGRTAEIFRQRLSEISGPFQKSLGKLTGLEPQKVLAWRKWFEKAKRKKWK